MKRLIIFTLLLLAATVTITVAYFRHLNPPGRRTSQVINAIPNTASLIFEFNNDDSFYEIYDSSALFSSIVGPEKLHELDILHKMVLQIPVFKPAFDGQNIYISVHAQQNNEADLLITLPAAGDIKPSDLAALNSTEFTFKAELLAGKPGYHIHLTQLNKDFYLIHKDHNIFSGSFSKALAEQSAVYNRPEYVPDFKLLSDQQAANTLGTLYISNQQLTPLFDQLFKSSSYDLLKPLRMLPANAALSLNYKSDALMFSGITSFKDGQPLSYLNLFSHFKPVVNHIQTIFPATTAYSTAFAVDTVSKFVGLLKSWQQKAGLGKDKALLFSKIKSETGVQFEKEFNKQLSNEFAVITTRFDEKIAIIQIKNGSALRPFISNISTMTGDNESGQLNYDRLPLYLLGDAFTVFRRPYFIILDNYLVLANTQRDISNYKDNYLNSRFLSKSNDFNEFSNLLAQQSNVSFYINFKNSTPVFEHHLKSRQLQNYEQKYSLKSFYGASYQLSASDNEFYTNFCIKANQPDSTTVK